jgi:hypothetical protein
MDPILEKEEDNNWYRIQTVNVCVVKSTMWPDKHVARQQQYLVSAL